VEAEVEVMQGGGGGAGGYRASFPGGTKINIIRWNNSNNSWRRWNIVFRVLQEQMEILQYFQQLHQVVEEGAGS
jgi:hypothetical protein